MKFDGQDKPCNTCRFFISSFHLPGMYVNGKWIPGFDKPADCYATNLFTKPNYVIGTWKIPDEQSNDPQVLRESESHCGAKALWWESIPEKEKEEPKRNFLQRLFGR